MFTPEERRLRNRNAQAKLRSDRKKKAETLEKYVRILRWGLKECLEQRKQGGNCQGPGLGEVPKGPDPESTYVPEAVHGLENFGPIFLPLTPAKLEEILQRTADMDPSPIESLEPETPSIWTETPLSTGPSLEPIPCPTVGFGDEIFPGFDPSVFPSYGAESCPPWLPEWMVGPLYTDDGEEWAERDTANNALFPEYNGWMHSCNGTGQM
ncbi:hypothetical protein K470DRAFT_254057 [Piedraia hortae CBS 480.64]|uniref:BZIP domain-containing protein n=1 Tax=Piedraia hortae CBS 480.64 TaxID=1314780 RepID=A0A6A7CAH1_9PEZI|nr:hypothetical protein K470DRAFT_254057 [Piedraia hortae CBS 480.64]